MPQAPDPRDDISQSDRQRDGREPLWLFPSVLERDRFLAAWDDEAAGLALPRIELCGFGVIAAAAVTAVCLQRHRPSRVILLGIAGTYDSDLAPVGTAVQVAAVETDAVGAEQSAGPATAADRDTETQFGRGDLALPEMAWQLPDEMGFQQVPAEAWAGSENNDALAKWTGRGFCLTSDPAAVGLLTVGVASGSEATGRWRRRRFPDAAIEDMEGYAVVMSSRLAGVPCEIWRGISNLAGDRRIGNWRIDQALRSLASCMAQRSQVGG